MRFTPLGFFIRAFAPLWRWMGGMIGKVAGLLGPVLSWLGGMLGRLGGVLAGAFAYLGGLFMRFTPLGFIIRNWAPIGGFLANLWNGAKALVGQAMTALIGFIAHGDPVGALIAAFAKVWPWLTGLAGRFQTIGGQLMAGMVAGITNGLAGLKKAITGMAGQAVGWIKQKLGIHSPSRVFAGLGRYTMAGLEQGIRKGQDGPLNAIRQTAAALAAGMAATAAVAAPASPTAGGVGPRLTSPPAASAAPQRGGDHIEIHIHSLPSQSPADIAREVRKALADVERERAGRARASFSDEE
jgi:phage-related minor tail protein